jgi:TnpA family transposase
MSSYLSRFIGADRLPRNLADIDIDVFFRLPADTIEALKGRVKADRLPGAENRMVGMAAQVVFLRTTGRTLDNVSLLPVGLLRYLGTLLGAQAPTIASLRSLYQRRATLTSHQLWAREHLGLSPATKPKLEELGGVLRTLAGDAISVDDLVSAAQQWLYEQKVLIPSDRVLRDIAREAFAHIEREAIRIVKAAVPKAQQSECRKAVFSKRTPTSMTVLEWLRTPPKKHSPSTLAETLEKVTYLKGLHVHTWDLHQIPLARQHVYAQAIAGRPPSDSRKAKDDRQLLEVICFLRARLLEWTESSLLQTGRRVSDFTRQASDKTQAQQARRAGDYRAGLVSVKELVEDSSRTPEQRLEGIKDIVDALGDLSPKSHAAVVRAALIEEKRIRSLLKAVSGMEFRGRPNEPVLRQLEIVRSLHAAESRTLPTDIEIPVSKVWKEAVHGEDRERALRALEASTILGLRRSLRRGSIWIDHSLSFREQEQMLIPRDEWERDKARYLSALGVSADADTFLTPLLEHVKAGLAALREAKEAGAVTVDTQGLLHLPKIEALPEEIEPERLRTLIYERIGDVQFPELILEIDSLTNFSEILLGRRANDEHELVALYAALIAHGTDVDAKGVAAMIPQLDPGHVATAMRALETTGRMTRAIRRIVEFQSQHVLAKLWGSGELGSSDMMSIDAPRKLWNARTDPRRRTFAVGLYTHVLNSYPLFFHWPVVLNERQAGPAIAGVVSHNQYTALKRIARLAVDTHGYTHPGMAIAKLLGFDLCPQLRDLAERKLYLPRSIDTPEGLDLLVHRDVSLRAIRKHWDELLRVVASIVSGRVSADVALQRLGSAAKGDPVYSAAEQLGMLLRTVFLCDYFANPEFRRELHAVLNRGESVHQLQRVVHDGKLGKERGRRRDELFAISGAHTLLTNLVIAWNTYHMQRVVDRMRKTGQEIEDRWLERIGPAHFRHINFRGLFRFGIDRYREYLLRSRGTAVRARDTAMIRKA